MVNTSPTFIAILLPPSISLIYSISVQVFLSGWHECSWKLHAASISLRLAILVASIGISLALQQQDETNNDKIEFKSFIPSVIFSSMISTLLVFRTRKIYVNGPKPNLSVVMKNARGKVMMITGSNTGIGKETARQLLSAGATVIMACRSEIKAKNAMEDILSSLEKDSSVTTDSNPTTTTAETLPIAKNNNNNTIKKPRERLLFVPCDVSNYNSIKKCVENFVSMKLPLHVLINNAGIMMGSRKENENGHELTMSANHLGHFLLTNLLLPYLQQTDGRVIIVTSSTYALATKGIDLEDLQSRQRKYTMFSQYAQSKLANILMGKELARREHERLRQGKQKNIKCSNPLYNETCGNHVKVFSVHPGLVRTDVVRNMPWYLRLSNMIFAAVLLTLQKHPEAGAYTIVFCATADHLDSQTGNYFSNSQVYDTNEFANDMSKAKALWDYSCELVGL